MMEEMFLREYRREDLDAMFRLDEICFEPTFQFSRSTMRRFAEARNAHVVVAESAGALAGFGILHVEQVGHETFGYIVTLDVAEGFRRLGLAKRLMLEMESQAAEAGCTAVLLHVYTGNDGAIRFYEAQGYTMAYTADGFYGLGLDALAYQKELTLLAVASSS